MHWTCLVLDLRSILSLYLNRRYSHLKSVKLCANLLVKNLCTSDLVFDPGEELRPWGGLWFLQPSLDGTPAAWRLRVSGMFLCKGVLVCHRPWGCNL